jgi:hypothetical protein
MLGYFPTPYPDELLYSILARLYALLKFSSAKVFVRELFGTPHAMAVADLPSNLAALLGQLPLGHGYTVDEIIDRLTLLPYYTAFLPVERLARLRADMRGNGGTRVHMRSGVMASGVPMATFFRMCPMCFDEDWHRHGENYWHREHQLPGVAMCPKHEVALQKTFVRTTNARTRYEYVAARQRLETVALNIPYTQPGGEKLLFELAQSSAWLLNQCLPPADPLSLCRLYRQMLFEKGFASASGRVRVADLRGEFRAYYSAPLLSWWGCDLDPQNSEPWLLRIVRKPDNAHHPLQHLLLIHFLRHTAESFMGTLYRQMIVDQLAQLDSEQRFGNEQDHSEHLVMSSSESVRDKKRSAWLALCAAKAGFGVRQLRIISAGIYTWLYRHDRAWLQEHAPTKLTRQPRLARVNWVERDQQLAFEIPRAAEKIRSLPGQPRRVTLTELGKTIGHSALIRRHADKLPRTMEVIGAEVEDRTAFAARRICWAAEQYGREGIIPKRWELTRRAGIARLVKRQQVQEALEFALAGLQIVSH